MKVITFFPKEFGSNNYLIVQNKEAILIDVSFNISPIVNYLTENNVKLKAILLTHSHFDHIGKLEHLRNLYKVPVFLHKNEEQWLMNSSMNGSQYFSFIDEIICSPADYLINNEEKLSVGDFEINIIFTPGHTPGGVSYYIKPWVFTGDTLFNQSIGRTDLFGGDYNKLIKSIKERLFLLPNKTIVYPGHGEKTTIIKEKTDNFYLG